MENHTKKILLIVLVLAILGIGLFFIIAGTENSEATCEVPILMYHNLAEEGNGGETISVDAFEMQMKALRDAGYTALFLDDLRSYVYGKASLPKKSVVITFDDGYQSVFDLAMPILKKYDLKATVFVVGWSVGKNVYKDGLAMNSHFDLQTAAKVKSSGVFDIQSHSYDLHQVAGRDKEPVRAGIIRLEGESESEYIETINKDCVSESKLFEDASLPKPFAFAYPYGKVEPLGRSILLKNGIELTLTTDTGFATLVKGQADSLLDLNRFNITDNISGSELIELVTLAE